MEQAREVSGADALEGDNEQVIEAALQGLSSQRYRVREAIAHVPNMAGLYAVYAPASAWQQLRLHCPGEDQPLYVGKAERSLVSRDLKTHFATGRTGSSTLRRSFAALLRDDLALRAVPRNEARPERPANFALEADGDERLTTWMLDHLVLAVWVNPSDHELDQIESAVLDRLQPPLNLNKVAQPSATVRAARRAMADDARAWARDRGTDLA